MPGHGEGVVCAAGDVGIFIKLDGVLETGFADVALEREGMSVSGVHICGKESR